MNVIHVIVIVFTVLVAILLIGIVLVQKSKGGGLSSQFGGANSMLGVRQTNTFLEKGTWWLAGILVLLSVLSVYTMGGNNVDNIRSIQTETTTQDPGAANQFDTPVIPTATPDAAAVPVAPEQTNE